MYCQLEVYLARPPAALLATLNVRLVPKKRTPLSPRRKKAIARAAAATRLKTKQFAAAAERTSPEIERITFSPNEELRAKMIDILKRRPSNAARKALCEKLQREFLRIYHRHRRVVQPRYETMPQERKHALTAAQHCIRRGVTPTDVIEYWAEHIGNFTGMKFPTLNYLALLGSVDRVSVERGISFGKRAKGTKPTVHPHTRDLNPALARGLIEAGLIVPGEISESYLHTVQRTAYAISQGHEMFVAKKYKSLVQWAVENLYAPSE